MLPRKVKAQLKDMDEAFEKRIYDLNYGEYYVDYNALDIECSCGCTFIRHSHLDPGYHVCRKNNGEPFKRCFCSLSQSELLEQATNVILSEKVKAKQKVLDEYKYGPQEATK